MKLQTTVRTVDHKALKALRNEGKIPAVLYCAGKDTQHLFVEASDFYRVYKENQGKASFVFIDVEGQEYQTILKDMQIHPATRKVQHLDFQEVLAGSNIEMTVPIKITGVAPGVRAGGKIDTHLRSVSVQCLPKDLPEVIVADISNIKLNESLRIADVETSYPALNFKLPSQATILSIALPKKVEAIDTEEAEAETETE